MTLTNESILIARPDRIGDVLLSTPVLAALKRFYPGVRLTFLVQPLVYPLIKDLPFVDDVILFEPNGRHAGVGGFFRLKADIASKRIDAAIILQSHRKVTAAVWWAGIPRRIGPLSKPHSYFFLNEGVRQRRSLVEMHEADYNLQLLRAFGTSVGSRAISTEVAFNPQSVEWARSWFGQNGGDLSRPIVVVHPAMGGSALNWPEDYYVELITSIARSGTQVLVTTGPEDQDLLDRIRSACNVEAESAKILYYGGSEARGIEDLAALFDLSRVVVAPSTGPLHIAVALGKRTVTFFPPIRVQSALRWGPYLEDESRSSILVPENYCGEDYKCRGSLCNFFPCMNSLTAADAFREVNRQLEGKP